MIMTIQDIMNKFKISKPTVYKWIKEGMPVMKNGRIIRFDDTEVEKWIKVSR